MKGFYEGDQKNNIEEAIKFFSSFIPSEISKFSEEKNYEKARVIHSWNIPSRKVSVEDFTKYFQARFTELKKILQEHSSLTNLTSIGKISSQKQDLSIIGMVNDKRVTKTKNIILKVENLSGKKTPGEWASRLTHLVDDFFSADESMEIEKQILGRAFDFLANLSKVYGFDQEIGLPEIRFWLKNHLANQKGGGFISRGTTFCAMLPFRSIPAKIICLIGMNSNACPREHHLSGFDLMAAHPRPGDRNGRNEDKYLFLQALLSARERF